MPSKSKLCLETMLPFESYFSSYYSKFRDSSQALLFWKKQKRNENFWFPKVFKKLDHFENRRHDFLVFHSLRNFGKSWEEQFTGKKKFRSTSEKSFDLHDANRRRFERRTRATGKFSHRLDCLNFLSKEKKVEAGSKLKIRIEKKGLANFLTGSVLNVILN